MWQVLCIVRSGSDAARAAGTEKLLAAVEKDKVPVLVVAFVRASRADKCPFIANFHIVDLTKRRFELSQLS